MVEAGHGNHEKRSTAAVEDYPLPRLEDPLEDRQMKDVPTPPKFPLSAENLYQTRDGKLTLTLFSLIRERQRPKLALTVHSVFRWEAPSSKYEIDQTAFHP